MLSVALGVTGAEIETLSGECDRRTKVDVRYDRVFSTLGTYIGRLRQSSWSKKIDGHGDK